MTCDITVDRGSPGNRRRVAVILTGRSHRMSPMSPRFRRWWPWLKWLFVIAVVVGICWHLMSILQSEELTEGDDARTPAGILWDAIRSASTPGLILSCLF